MGIVLFSIVVGVSLWVGRGVSLWVERQLTVDETEGSELLQPQRDSEYGSTGSR